MGTSPITVTALTATPTLRGNKLAATVSATGPAANIPSLMLANVEFYASTTNDFTTASYVGEGNPEFVHAGLIEEQTYYYWARARAVNRDFGAVFPVSPTAGVACTAIGMSGLAFGIANGKLVPSVSGNALTVALKTAAGSDPSTSNPVFVAFPSANAASGSYTIRAITAALSMTVSSGSTMGVLNNNVAFRLWVLLFDDSGTLRLGLALRSQSSGGILPLTESGIASSTAEGGAGGADGDFIYTAVAVTAKAYRILGYVEYSSGLAAVGTWAVEPDINRLVSGGLRPGDVIQEFSFQTGQPDGATASIPWDNTTPQNSEGVQFASSWTMTPASAANWFDFDILLHMSRASAGEIIVAIFRDSEADAIGCGVASISNADEIVPVRVRFRVQALTAAARSFSIRYGASASVAVAINSTTAAFKLNTKLYSHVSVKEIMG